MDYTIKYRNKTNLDFNMLWDVGDDFELGTGAPNVDQTDVAGVNGTLLDFNGSYKSFSQKFVFYAVSKDTTAAELKSKINEWLLKDTGYSPLQFSNDPDYYYDAAPDPDSVIKFPAYNKRFAKVEISFIIKPFKHRLSGTKEINIPKGEFYLTNPENWASYPLIHIKANNQLTIKLNERDYQLTTIDGEVFIDSQPEISCVYHDLGTNGIRNRNAIFPDHQFPALIPGTNKLIINGDYQSATIIPRWQAIC